jgi:hypothetical protein
LKPSRPRRKRITASTTGCSPDGEDRDAEEIAANSPFRCDLTGCIGKVKKGKTIALVRHPAALEEDCRIADIVIAPFSVGKGCSTARVVVDRRALQAEGAHAIYVEGLSIRSESVAETRGRGGPGCRSVPFRSRLCRLARLTPAIQVPTTARMIAPSTVIPMSEA